MFENLLPIFPVRFCIERAGLSWYATYCALAGVDPTDHKAAAAGLPPIDRSATLPPHTHMCHACRYQSSRASFPLVRLQALINDE